MAHEIPIDELLEHSGWLRALAARLVPGRAEDLVQATWLAALLHPPRAATPARPWLARVLGNLVRNEQRGEARRRKREESLAGPEPAPGTDAIALEAEAQRLLAEEVARLAEPLRTVVVLRFYRGLSSRAIAREVGAPAGTVRWRLKAALDELRAALDRRHGGNREAWLALLVPLARAAPPRAPFATMISAGKVVLAAGMVSVITGVAWRLFGAASAPAGPFDPDKEAMRAGSAAAAVPSAGIADARPAAARSPVESRADARTPETSEEAAHVADEGSMLAGILLVDGRAPRVQIQLKLTAAEPRPARAADGPARATGDAAKNSWTLRGRYGTDGSFRLWGLPVGWSGRLSAPGYVFESGEYFRPATAPATDLVLRLRAEPGITGRILDAAGMPVVEASGLLRHAIESEAPGGAGDSSTFGSFQTDAEGFFRVPLEDAEPDTVGHAWLLVELDEGFAERESADFEPTKGLDFGDVPLAPTRALGLHVRDASGSPIAGAVARVVGPILLSRASVPTDAAGETSLPFVPSAGARVRVDALRHQTRVLEIGDAASLETVLEPATGLSVRCLGAEPGALAHLRVALVAPEELFAEPGSASLDELDRELEKWLREELGATPLSGSRSTGGMLERLYRPDGAGRIELPGLPPGVAFSVELRDDEGRVLVVRSATTAAGEWQELELSFAR